MYKSIVLYTAGIDSFILLEYIRQHKDKKTKPVYFNLGHKYSEEEENLIKQNEPKCIVDHSIKIGDLERPDAFIPNRNIFLTLMAASKYSKTVYIGGSLSDRVCDNNKEVFDSFSTFLTKLDGKDVITITSPFWDVYKVDMVKWYKYHAKGRSHKNNKFDLLYNTFSCFNPTIKNSVKLMYPTNVKEPYESKHCHSCNACFRRNVILSSAGITLPFFNQDIIKHYEREFSNTLITTPRGEATLEYINRLTLDKEER